MSLYICFFFFSSRRRHTRFDCDWSSDVCSSDILRRRADQEQPGNEALVHRQKIVAAFHRHLAHAVPALADRIQPVVRHEMTIDIQDRKSTRLNSITVKSRMPSSA